jgi:hypothetical protein
MIGLTITKNLVLVPAWQILMMEVGKLVANNMSLVTGNVTVVAVLTISLRNVLLGFRNKECKSYQGRISSLLCNTATCSFENENTVESVTMPNSK